MDELFNSSSYSALFLISFLAASIIPLGSEWLLSAMIIQGFNPVPVVVVATAGNYLGGCTTYLIGFYGAIFLIRKVFGISKAAQLQAENIFQKYGSWTLLFSWLPIIGDPLCLAAGLFRISVTRFSILVILGKLARYVTVAILILGGMQASV